MIKHIPSDNPSILSFYVETEMDQPDVEWMVRLIETTYQRKGKKVLLFVEFGSFGRLTPYRTIKHWHLLFTHARSLSNHVDKIFAISDSIVLRSKLFVEFNLLPRVTLKALSSSRRNVGLNWLAG